MNKWKKLDSKLVLEAINFKVREDIVEYPDGRRTKWTYWDSPESVMILGMTDDKKLIFERQYRYLVGEELLEVPAGSVKEEETIEGAARREFREEVGYTAENFIPLGAFYETYGQLNRRVHMFFAPNAQRIEQDPDRGNRGYEEIEVELKTVDEAVSLALTNLLPGTPSTLIVLLLSENINKGKIKI